MQLGYSLMAGLIFIGWSFSCVGANVGDLPEVFKIDEYEDVKDIYATIDRIPTPDEVEIPRMAERLYGESDLQRLPVIDIVIEGVVPYPEYGITQEAVQKIIDDRFKAEQDRTLDENGFTNRDLLDIGRFLRDIMDRGVLPDAEDAESLIRLIRESEDQRGYVTIQQLDQIALAVTEFYRDRGFILAQAFIPEQEVKTEEKGGAVIRFNVLEGRLGDVTVSNNQIFEETMIASAFSNELGEAVTEERIEGALRRINDLPGVRVRGSFSPGTNVGETRLNLGVLEEKSWSSSILFDNHGSNATGENRIFATTEWLNIRHRGHRLVGGLLRSEGPDSSFYGTLEYELPITRDARGKVRGSVSTNQFSVNLPNLPEIVGETNNYGITGTYQFLRSRTLNLKGQIGYTQKDVLFKVGELTTLSSDEVIDVTSVAGDYTQLWDEQQLLLTGRFGVDQGNILSGESRGQSSDFTKLQMCANLLKRFSVHNWVRGGRLSWGATRTDSFFNFVVKMNAQYTKQSLSPVEQFSLGGPSAVRAFGVSDLSMDSGVYAGAELYFNMPVDLVGRFKFLPIEQPRPYLFFDYGYGVNRGLEGIGDKDATVKAFGLGFRVVWPGRFTANFVFAKPKSANYEDDFLEVPGESRVFLDVIYQVR